MGQQQIPRISSDKLIWSQIYRTLKETLKSQQSQIEALIKDRDFLENNANIQHEHWSSRIRFFESHIAQMKNEQAKTRLFEDTKMAVLVGFKESEALSYKIQLDLAERDLEDFFSCVGLLCAEMEELKEKLKGFETTEVKSTDYSIEHPGPSENFNGKNQLTLSSKKEIKKLKHAYRELCSKRDTEVSALLAEKDFVWNQFRKIENDFALFKGKHTEADKKLQNSVDKFWKAITKKDEIIFKLEAERSMLELNARKHAEEADQANNKMKRLHAGMEDLRLEAMEKDKLIDNLRKELCNLRTDLKKNSLEKSLFVEKSKSEGKSKSGSNTRQIHLQRCSKEYKLESGDTHTSQTHTNPCGVTCDTPAFDIHRRVQNLTEKKRRLLSPVETKSSLFHSDFKVPKLKRPRPLTT